MAKRKQSDHADGTDKPTIREVDEEMDSSDSGEDTDMLNVDFEWFDPQPEHDFQGLKTLLRQSFDVDAQLFDLSTLTDLILSQPLLGSTVKVDGNETDPYAFLTILNLREHRDKTAVKALTTYLNQKANFPSALGNILHPDAPAQVGLILTERLINIPSEVVPPMYQMLQEEIAWALQDKEPYSFSYYLILSKTYVEVASSLDQEDDRLKKKSKKAKDSVETFYFHPEDEILHQHALWHGDFSYTKEEGEGHSDSKRTFQEMGVKPQGHMILIEAAKFEPAVKAVADFLRPA
ncbi:MAG: Mss4p nuclear export [Caeruleum heppii]|nr:MAG: Mss4p nuclear export [Caeruleum heppii]